MLILIPATDHHEYVQSLKRATLSRYVHNWYEEPVVEEWEIELKYLARELGLVYK